MQMISLRPDPRRWQPGFTLVEMLVVIAIISILMTAGSIGLSGLGGKGVTSGVATVESLFDEARSTAVARNVRACVLVAKDLPDNHADDLRRVVVAYEEVDSNGAPVSEPDEPPNWVLSSRGTLLPDQVYFSQKFSKKDHDSQSGPVSEIEEGRIKDAKAAYKGTYYIFEFNDQGICTTPGASFVIGSGVRNTGRPASEQPPKVAASARRDFGGFVVWRNGRTSLFHSPEQISSTIDSLKPGEQF